MTNSNENQATTANQPEVRHNEQQRRFELDVDGDVPAHADYTRNGNTLVFDHTYVPDSARGQGLAAKVVRAGLDYARDKNFTVEPSCSYVASYIERHPEYQELVE